MMWRTRLIPYAISALVGLAGSGIEILKNGQ